MKQSKCKKKPKTQQKHNNKKAHTKNKNKTTTKKKIHVLFMLKKIIYIYGFLSTLIRLAISIVIP